MDLVYEINGMGPEEGQAMSAPCIALVYSVILDSLRPHGLYSPWNSPGQNTGVGSLFLLRGSSQPRDRTQVSHIAVRFFTS